MVDATVLDLFAGSGALGIEALSRGAAHATFIDRASSAMDAVRTNLATCGLEDRATLTRADGERYLAASPDHTWDLALLDPPHAFDRWTDLLAALAAGVAVVESDRPIDAPDPMGPGATEAIRQHCCDDPGADRKMSDRAGSGSVVLPPQTRRPGRS